MSFLLKQSIFQYNPSGVFVHVPKCAGTTAQGIFKKCGYKLYRKNEEYRAHLTLSETIRILKKSYPLDVIKKMNIYITLREATSWMESFYRYIIEKEPKIHGCTWEYENFKKYGMLKYIEMSLSRERYLGQIPIEANELPYRKLSSYISLKDFDINGIENTKVFIFATNSLDSLVENLSGSKKHFNTGNCNSTSGKKIMLDELGNDYLKFGKLKNDIHDYHYSEISFEERLFNEGFYFTTLKDLQ
jgi:hypothetical protein